MSDVFNESKKGGLHPNLDKTKIMTNTDISCVTVNGTRFDVVENYTYLGQVTSFTNNEEKAIEARISAAWKSYWSLKKFFKSALPMFHKRRLFDACVLPVFTYGTQALPLSQTAQEKLRVAQRSMERSMMNIRLTDQVNSQRIRKTTKVKDVVETAKQLKWNWAGHISRYEDDRLPKVVETWTPRNCTRSRGRPHLRWKDDIQNFASCFWRRKSINKQNWKKMGISFIQL